MATPEAEVNDDDDKRDDTNGNHSYANNAHRNESGYDYPLTWVAFNEIAINESLTITLAILDWETCNYSWSI